MRYLEAAYSQSETSKHTSCDTLRAFNCRNDASRRRTARAARRRGRQL